MANDKEEEERKTGKERRWEEEETGLGDKWWRGSKDERLCSGYYKDGSKDTAASDVTGPRPADGDKAGG